MATTNTNAAKTVAKKAAQDPKVAKVLAEETTKATIRNLGNNINKNNVLFSGLGVTATVATTATPTSAVGTYAITVDVSAVNDAAVITGVL